MPITYTDKILHEDKPEIPIIEKWRFEDANEVKTVVNANETTLGGKQAIVNTAVALVDGATIDITAIKHTLTSTTAAITFTISYTGDEITIYLTLNAITSVLTFPSGSSCISDGEPSGGVTCTLFGVSGDKYAIVVKKVGSDYIVVSKNLIR